jgi:hypothetical protein
LEPGEFDPALLDSLQKKYVRDGRVDYGAWKANDLETLDAFLDSAADYDLTTVMGKEPRAAFLINAYNAWAVRQILGQYPVKSITEIPGFFDENRRKIAGEMHTLSSLEKALAATLRHRPLFAFALASGTAGGPKLLPTAFTEENFDTLLHEYAAAYLMAEDRITYDEKSEEVHIPPEMNAYLDFYRAFPRGIGEVVSQYVSLQELVVINQRDVKFVVDPNDMTLNDVSAEASKKPPSK